MVYRWVQLHSKLTDSSHGNWHRHGADFVFHLISFTLILGNSQFLATMTTGEMLWPNWAQSLGRSTAAGFASGPFLLTQKLQTSSSSTPILLWTSTFWGKNTTSMTGEVCFLGNSTSPTSWRFFSSSSSLQTLDPYYRHIQTVLFIVQNLIHCFCSGNRI